MNPLRNFLALLLFCTLCLSASAQTIRGKPPGELRKVMADALAAGKRVTGLQPRIEQNKVVFDVTLAPNPDKTEWLALLNLTPQQFAQAKARYAGDGFSVAVQSSITANNQQFHSAVWMRTSVPVSTLVLPNDRLPISGAAVEQFKVVDELMRTELKRMNATGATLAIGKAGNVLYDRAFGWANIDPGKPMEPTTPMRIADISKTLTAVAVMKLVDSGKLKLDDRVIPMLKKARLRGFNRISDTRWNAITIRHLLQHTAGWDASVAGDILFRSPLVAQELRLRSTAKQKDVVRYQLQRPLQFDPGQQFKYSNFGYCLLGRIIEIAADEPYGSYVQKQILTPTKMEHTKRGRTRVSARPKSEAFYHMQREKRGTAFWSAAQAKIKRAGKTVDPPDIVRLPDGSFNLEVTDASNGWTSTASDLVRFALATESTSTPLLQPATRKEMLAPPQLKPKDDKTYYAGGWWVTEDKAGQRIWHGGAFAGSSAMLVREPDGVVWAVLFNTDAARSGKPLASELEPKLREKLKSVQW